MRIGKAGLLAVVAAAMALIGSADIARAAQNTKRDRKGAAAGKVSKVDTAAKTFVVSSKKKGDITIAYTDQTKFKKASDTPGTPPADAAATDVSAGSRVVVQGKTTGTKVEATEVTIGGARKRKKLKL